MSASVIFRPGVEDDGAFVFESFMRSMRKSAYAEGANFAVLSQHFLGLLTEWKLLVACTNDDPDTILGWVLYRDADTVAHVLIHKLHRAWLRPYHLLRAAAVAKTFSLVFPNTRDPIDGEFSFRVRPWIHG